MKNHHKPKFTNFKSLYKIVFDVKESTILSISLEKKGVLGLKPKKEEYINDNIIYYMTHCSSNNVINHLYCQEQDKIIKNRIKEIVDRLKFHITLNNNQMIKNDRLFDYYFKTSENQLKNEETVETIMSNFIRPTQSGKKILLYKKRKEEQPQKNNTYTKIDLPIKCYNVIKGAVTIKVQSKNAQKEELIKKIENLKNIYVKK